MDKVEVMRWVLEDQITDLTRSFTDETGLMYPQWPDGWFQVRTSGLTENQVVMVWARRDDGELEPARVMHRITHFDENNEALYALRFEEE